MEEGSPDGESIGLGDFVEENRAHFEGINPNMDLYSVRVLDEFNMATPERIIEGIRWAIDNGMDILNISAGTGEDDKELHKIIKEAYRKGMLIISAAGNDGETQYPAAYDEVVAVGNVGFDGTVEACCATDGSIELTAPAEAVLTVGPFGVETEAGGTSMAAAQVSALASLLWQQDASVSGRFIRSLMQAGANRSDKSASGYGIVDAAHTLSIMESFKEGYEEAALPEEEEPSTEEVMEDAGILENTEDVEVVGEMVQANWGGKDHLKLITKSKATITEKYLNMLKIGIRLQDIRPYGLWGKEELPAFHGYYGDYTYTKRKEDEKEEENKKLNEKKKRAVIQNKKYNKKIIEEGDTLKGNYVAGYMYLTRLAMAISKSKVLNYRLPDNNQLWSDVAGYFNGVFDKKGIYAITSEGIEEESGKSSWDDVLCSRAYAIEKGGDPEVYANITSGELRNNLKEQGGELKGIDKNIAIPLVIYGMGLHTLSDTFAHSAYGCKKTLYKWSGFGEGNDKRKVRKDRYKAARQTVKKSLNHVTVNRTMYPNEHNDEKKYKLQIKNSNVNDFCPNGIKKKKGKGRIESLNKYIVKKNGKTKLKKHKKYLKEGFAVKSLRKYMKACNSKVNKSVKWITLHYVVKKLAKFKSAKIINKNNGKILEIVKKKKQKKGKRASTNAVADSGEDEEIIIQRNVEGKKKVSFALAKDLEEGYEYEIRLISDAGTVRYTIDGNTRELENTCAAGEKLMMRQWDMENVSAMEEKGDITVSGKLYDGQADASHPLGGATITMTDCKTGRVLCTATSGPDGWYHLADCAEGVYNLTIEKKGCLTAEEVLTLSGSQNPYYNTSVVMLQDTGTGTGSVTGRVLDAVTGDGIPRLTVHVRKGLNNLDGEILKTAATSNTASGRTRGTYTFKGIPAGHYCVEIVDGDESRIEAGKRYVSTYKNITIRAGEQQTGCSIHASRVLEENQMRMVLTWGKAPTYLDARLDGICAGGGGMEINFNAPRLYSAEGELLAILHEKNGSGYSPEVITVYDTQAVSFMYLVQNSSKYMGETQSLEDSGAEVYVYRGDRLEEVIHVCEGDEGLWHIFWSYAWDSGLDMVNRNVTPDGIW